VNSRPLTQRELKAWIKYYATMGAYCPAGCGKKFTNDDQWVWKLPGRIYFICHACALGARDVIEPASVPAFLDDHQWVKGGHGLGMRL
jgi:hypothetical protein